MEQQTNLKVISLYYAQIHVSLYSISGKMEKASLIIGAILIEASAKVQI